MKCFIVTEMQKSIEEIQKITENLRVLSLTQPAYCLTEDHTAMLSLLLTQAQNEPSEEKVEEIKRHFDFQMQKTENDLEQKTNFIKKILASKEGKQTTFMPSGGPKVYITVADRKRFDKEQQKALETHLKACGLAQ